MLYAFFARWVSNSGHPSSLWLDVMARIRRPESQFVLRECGLPRTTEVASNQRFLSFGLRISSRAYPSSVKPSTTSTMHIPGAMIHQCSPIENAFAEDA